MSKRLGGIIITGCKNKTSSWHLNGFPDGSSMDGVNSIIIPGRNLPLCCTLTLIACKGHQARTKTKPLE